MKEHHILLIFLLLVTLPILSIHNSINSTGGGSLEAPDKYPDGMCELAAKELQNKFGGNLVFIVPYIGTQNIEGKFSGHWINRIYMSGNKQYYYIDYQNQMIFSSKESMIDLYSNIFKYKFNDDSVDAKVFIYGEDTIPFPIIWNH